ncbi:MAG: hypothetical protein KF729_10055 [Sandaracinaceae bacterium]|nr:hypothetical protein [Sandaracinaceae bacterium]
MRRFGWGLTPLALLFALLAGATARAQQPPGDIDEDARLHFELGQRAYDRGEFVTAAEEFEIAYRLSGRPPLLYNRYVALRDAQMRPQAAEALRAYLRDAGEIPNRARLEVVLAQLEAELAGEPPAADPGPPSPTVRASVRAAAAPSAGLDVTGPVVVTAIGAAALVASVITGALALDRNAALSAACPGDVCADESARGLQSDVETLSVVTDVLWPVGAVAAGAGLVWLVVALASGASADRASVDFSCGPTGCGLTARGAF